MQMYIPKLGDSIKLTAPWTFMLYNERRNESLIEAYLINPTTMYGTKLQNITLPEGIILKIVRIYIKQGNQEYNSISFSIATKKTPLLFKTKGAVRFWAKLDDVNKIEFEKVESGK